MDAEGLDAVSARDLTAVDTDRGCQPISLLSNVKSRHSHLDVLIWSDTVSTNNGCFLVSLSRILLSSSVILVNPAENQNGSQFIEDLIRKMELLAIDALDVVRQSIVKRIKIKSDILIYTLIERDELKASIWQRSQVIVRILQFLEKNCQHNLGPIEPTESFSQWRQAMRHAARLGLPPLVRRRVWLMLAERQLANQHVDWNHVMRVAFADGNNDSELNAQIDKDLHRTGCLCIDSDESRGSLRQVLLGFARWNKRVGYCQGFNVIAAIILDVTEGDAEEAFKIMVYLIDYVLPEAYFALNLQALSVDIAVFRHLLQTRHPRLSNHLDKLQLQDAYTRFVSKSYEPPLINVYVIQWFLTLFTNCVGPEALLRIWDSILLEGSEVILRTALVIMDFLASRLVKVKSVDQFYTTMNSSMLELEAGKIVSSRELLFEIYQLGPFPYPDLKELRDKFMYNVTPLVAPVASETTNKASDSFGRQRHNKLFGLINRLTSSTSIVNQPNGDCRKENEDQCEKVERLTNGDGSSSSSSTESDNRVVKIGGSDLSAGIIATLDLVPIQVTGDQEEDEVRSTEKSTTVNRSIQAPVRLVDYFFDLQSSRSKKELVEVNQNTVEINSSSHTPTQHKDSVTSDQGEGSVTSGSNLKHLKTLYSKQQAKQRDLILRLPDLWTVTGNESNNFLSPARQFTMTKFLPQSLQISEETNEKSSFSREEQFDQDEELVPNSASISATGDAESQVDQKLIDSILSWQTRTNWNKRRSLSTSNHPDDDQHRVNSKCSSHRSSSFHASSAPTLTMQHLDIAFNQNGQEFEGVNAGSENGQVDATNFVPMHENVDINNQTTPEPSKPRFVSTKSIILSKSIQTRRRMYQLASQQKSLRPEPKMVENEIHQSVQFDDNNVEVEANSENVKKPPWILASTNFHPINSTKHIYCELSNDILTQLNQRCLPITASRKAFGIQFGLYKALKPVARGFSDTLQLVELKRITQL